MNRAMVMEKTIKPQRAEYWRGFQRGLRRKYHGKIFGTPEEHKLWMSLISRNDEQSQQRGQGYRDGLEVS